MNRSVIKYLLNREVGNANEKFKLSAVSEIEIIKRSKMFHHETLNRKLINALNIISSDSEHHEDIFFHLYEYKAPYSSTKLLLWTTYGTNIIQGAEIIDSFDGKEVAFYLRFYVIHKIVNHFTENNRALPHSYIFIQGDNPWAHSKDLDEFFQHNIYYHIILPQHSMIFKIIKMAVLQFQLRYDANVFDFNEMRACWSISTAYVVNHNLVEVFYNCVKGVHMG